MRLRLLGPFELERSGKALALPGRGERALCALLALSADRVVAASTLVEALWSESSLPRDPANALQLRVSKLRRDLADWGFPDLVIREGAGYRLAVDPDAVDVHRFTNLVGTARLADELAAVPLYDEALALWWAEPLVDFAGERWTEVEVARLTELRLTAVAERAERMLSLGRYEQLVGDLEPVVREFPLRERLVGQLMSSLFNAGRQAEALEVYERTRSALVEELGLDPTPELRTLMEQILRQDVAITAPARPQPVVSPPAFAASPTARPQADGIEPGESVSGASGNLPLRVTTFVGREVDRDRVVEKLRLERLVTLAGPGGAGKTALAVEAAREVGQEFRDGAWLVRLALVTEPAMVPHAVADALEFGSQGGGDAQRSQDVLVNRLARRDLLLVLDNCEHLIDAAASLAEHVLARCPAVRILVTSREALAVPGEVQLPVHPLPVPVPGTPAAVVPEVPAARLFLDRAEAVAPDSVSTPDDLVAVAAICRRLDGIPLALELAAARLTSLTPVELAERVLDRFAVLTTGSRTAEARQRTLRQTVDWSYNLLTPAEQQAFRRVAVFQGGWSLAAAQEVLAGPALSTSQVFDLLERLVRQSLVVAEPVDGHTRYRMLETLRQYAADQLEQTGETNTVAHQHAAHYLGVAEQAEIGLRARSQAHWVKRLGEEHANLRTALTWLTGAAGHTGEALRLAGSLGLYWHMGRHLEGRETLRSVLALPGGSPDARARALQAVSLVERPRACIVHPSAQCAAAARESLDIFERVGDRPRAALSRLLLAVEGVGVSREVSAARLLEDADQEFAALDDAWGRAVVWFIRMEKLAKRGDEASTRRAAAEAIERFRVLGDGWGLSGVLYHFGYGLRRFGRYAEAVPVLEEAIRVAGDAGIYNTVQWATTDLGLTLLALGRIDDAAACLRGAGAVSEQVGDHAGEVLTRYGEAVLAEQAGHHETARPLFEEAVHGFEQLGVWLATGLALAGVAGCDEAVGALAAARDSYERLLNLAEEAGDVGLLVTALEGVARNSVDEDPVRTAELLGRATALRTTYDRLPTPTERSAAERTVAAVVATVGQQEYREAARRGSAVGLTPAP